MLFIWYALKFVFAEEKERNTRATVISPPTSHLISFFKPPLNLKCRHPHHQSLIPHPRPVRRWEGPKDSVIFYPYTCDCQAKCWRWCDSGGQLITLVWGLVTGYHPPALCCCQEPFTPSSSSANGTSESIKTIITANPTESKGNYFRWSRKTWLRRSNLSVQRVALWTYIATQPITVSIFYTYPLQIHRWSQRGFSPAYGNCSLAMNQPLFENCRSFILISPSLAGCLVGNRNLCLAVLDLVQTLSTTVFLLPPWLNEPLPASTQYLSSGDLHCASERSIAGQCVFERLSSLLQDS